LANLKKKTTAQGEGSGGVDWGRNWRRLYQDLMTVFLKQLLIKPHVKKTRWRHFRRKTNIDEGEEEEVSRQQR